MTIKKELAALGIRTAVDLMKIKQPPSFKVRDRYYQMRAGAIKKRGAAILSAQKVRLAKSSGMTRGAVIRETQAEIDLDLMALIHENEILRYRMLK